MYDGNVVLLEASDLVWPFHLGDQAQYRCEAGDGGWASTVSVDPFPCYAHDVRLVRTWLDRAVRAFPLDPAPTVFVLSHEPAARTNGWAESKTYWVTEDDGTRAEITRSGHIVLAGKRIPIHPAMTRYLVTHEYGHHVQYAIERARGGEPGLTDLLEEYAARRGLPPCDAQYGGGTWHLTPGEVFANDFRVLLVGAEREFWPHPGVPLPDECPGIVEWWAGQRLALVPA